MKQNSKIYVAGHTGMVGSAIVRLLQAEGYANLILKTSRELDLRNQNAVKEFFITEKPEYVFLAAAKVGGIAANSQYKADFLFDNLSIQTNVVDSAHKSGVKKLLFLGSSCIYPKYAPQPIEERYLLTGELEPTNESYAIAKIAGIKMCDAYRDQYGCNFISAMPTNLYGPNDNYDLKNSHVLPAMLSKFHNAKINGLPTVELWGTGNPRREFLHVDDLAAASLFLMLNYEEKGHINVGVGKDISIAELAAVIKSIVGYMGNVVWNTNMPDGTARKLLDISKMGSLGWKAKIELEKGILQVYTDKFLKERENE